MLLCSFWKCFGVIALIALPSLNLIGAQFTDHRVMARNNDTTRVNLSMCLVRNGSRSAKYCTCSENVVNCDFSEYTEDKKILVELNGRLINSTAKRLCICNTPKTLNLFLTREFLTRSANIHRIDLFNLSGPVFLTYSTYLNFGGDLYISNVAHLRKIRSFQTPRRDLKVEDVQNLECCSKISIQKYDRPTLYIENTTIGFIESQGIDPSHLWKTVILKHVQVVKGIAQYGIKLQDEVNASFTNCFFNNLADRAITVDAVSTFLMAKSTLNHSCHSLALVARSPLKNSTIAIIENEFLNVPNWEFDARWLIIQFNYYDFWHNETFQSFNVSKHKDRVVSVEFNTVENFLLESQDIPSENETEVFNENVLSLCNCSSFTNDSLPKILRRFPQRCDATNKNAKQNCTLDLGGFSKQCSQHSNINFPQLCSDKSRVKFPVQYTGFKDINSSQPIFMSKFLTDRVEEILKTHSVFNMRNVINSHNLYSNTSESIEMDNARIFQAAVSSSTKGNKQPQSGTQQELNPKDKTLITSKKSNSRSTGSTVLIVLLSMGSCLLGIGLLAYFVRKRLVSFRASRYMNLTSYSE